MSDRSHTFMDRLETALPRWGAQQYDDAQAGADADDTPNPARRDDTGEVPDDVTAPSGPVDFDDPHDLANQPRPVPVFELAGPVDVVSAQQWSGSTITLRATNDPVQVAPADPRRKSLTILNRGADTVYLSPIHEGTAGPPTRISVETDEARVMGHTGPVYAQIDTGGTGTATLEVLAERIAEVTKI